MPIKSNINEEPFSAFTSMIDLVFCLLIFFILQPFKEPENRMAADMPQEGSSSRVSNEVPLKEINIIIERRPSNPADAIFYIGENRARLVNQPGIHQKIADELLRQSNHNLETPIAILPAGEVNFEHVIHALDACYQANMPKVKFGGESPP